MGAGAWGRQSPEKTNTVSRCEAGTEGYVLLEFLVAVLLVAMFVPASAQMLRQLHNLWIRVSEREVALRDLENRFQRRDWQSQTWDSISSYSPSHNIGVVRIGNVPISVIIDVP